MKLLDTVRLNIDLPEQNLKKGTIGVIVEIYITPLFAYEVEFVDDNGKTINTVVLSAEDIILI